MHRSGDDNALQYLDFTAIDILAMQLSCLLMYWITRGGIIYQDPQFRFLAYAFLVAQISLGMFSDNYSGALSRNAKGEITHILLYTMELWLACLPFVLLARIPFSFLQLILVNVFFITLDFGGRLLIKRVRACLTHKIRKVVLITSSELVRRAILKIGKSKTGTTYEIIAICLTDNRDISSFKDLNLPVYHTTDPDLLDKLVTQWIDDAFFLAGIKTGYLSTLIEDFITMGITVHYSLSAMNDFASASVGVQSLGDYKVITNSALLVTPRAAFFKRTMDIIGGLAGLMVTAVLFIFIAPAIYIKSPGPIFFKQKRIGQNGKVFEMYKFRSMYMDAEKRKAELMARNKVQDGMMFKMDDDPRIIGSEKKDKNGKPMGIGNFIRKTSLDEFPQFLNVLKGEMSLVGTRPPTLDEWAKYSPHHRARMSVRPGITGIWQISGRSEITDFEEVVMLDRKYLQNWTPLLDVKILFKTVTIVLKRNGAS